MILPLQKPNRNEIIKLADSLLLKLDDAQLDLMEQEFASVVAQFERLLVINTDNVEPMGFVVMPGVRLPSRADAVSDKLFTRGELARNTASLLPTGLLLVNKE